MLHGRMQRRREQKPDADLANRTRGFLGRHIGHAHAQSLQHVRAPAVTRYRPVAVLGDVRAGSRHHDRRGGRNVERARSRRRRFRRCR